jgi:type III pantothenate kinase
MMLLLDVGNTSVNWGTHRAGHIETTGQFLHRGVDLDAQAHKAWSALPAPGKIVIANVAGSDPADRLSAWTMGQWGLRPEAVTVSASACGVTNAYSRPTDLGVDRWAALIGAHQHYSGAVCIVDCGTAITVDLLAAGGEHQGGLILPGTDMLQQLLMTGTVAINEPGSSRLATLLAGDTGAAVNGGAIYMAVATIDRVVADMTTGQVGSVETLITGGDAGRILPLLAAPAHHDPDLVLKGVAGLSGGE